MNKFFPLEMKSNPKEHIKKTVKKFLFSFNRNPLSIALYNQEIKRRSRLALTDIVPLSKHINMMSPFTSEIQPVNDWYGHATILKKFLGLPKNHKFKVIIEHGLYLSEQVPDIELESPLPTFVTYSQYRVRILKRYRQNAHAIGPFIHYAPHYLSEQGLRKEKKRLGRILLFFPSHSIIGSTNLYDRDWSCNKIAEMSKNFDTIRVCIYWKDVLLGMHKYYQDRGFECVTAGHILDPLFLSRLKSIIQTADLTVSNDASSPLSYCIFMGKPHIILYQRPNLIGQKKLKKIMSKYWKSKPYAQVIKEFSKIEFIITDKQRELMNFYCGTNNIKSKTELKKIIEETEQIYQDMH